jgi:uncharacterized protein YdiU (UPF0061 family)
MKEWYDWLERYSIRINEEKLYTERKEQMNLVNPKYVLRNYICSCVLMTRIKEIMAY